jgi:hypothetical protein
VGLVAVVAHLEDQAGVLAELRTVVERVSAELAVSAYKRRQTRERVDIVLRQLTELRGSLGVVEATVPPRATRRRPLAS